MTACCYQISVYFAEFSDVGKQDKRHTEHDNKPHSQLSGRDACVLLTTDERTTGTLCCSHVDGCCFLHCSHIATALVHLSHRTDTGKKNFSLCVVFRQQNYCEC